MLTSFLLVINVHSSNHTAINDLNATKIAEGEKVDFPFQTVFPSGNQSMIINVTRKFTISEYMLVFLNDTIVVKNNGSEPFNGFLIYYEKKFYTLLRDVKILGKAMDSENGRSIELRWSMYVATRYYVGIKVQFDRHIYEGDIYSCQILAYGINLITYKRVDEGLFYYLNVTQDMLLPYKINYQETRCLRPKETDLIEQELKPEEYGQVGEEVFWKKSDVKPLNVSIPPSELDKIVFAYTPRYTQEKLPIQILSITRSIEIKVSGKVIITDKITVLTYSPELQDSRYSNKWGKSSIVLGLLPGVDTESVKAEDMLGELEVEKEPLYAEGKFENFTFVRVNFRDELIGGEVYEVSISFEVPSKDNIEKKEERYILKIPLLPIVNAAIPFVKLEIISPYKITNVNEAPLQHAKYVRNSSLSGILLLPQYVYKVAITNMLPSQNNYLNIKYAFDSLSIIIPFVIVFQIVFFVIAISIIALRKAGERKILVELEEMPEHRKRKETLIKFIATYEEYLSLEQDLFRDIQNKIISKRPSAREIQLITTKLNELKKRKSRLYSFSEVIKRDPDIEPLITQVNTISAKIDLTLRKLLDDLNYYIKGAMKRGEFISEATITAKELRSLLSQEKRILNSLREILIVKYTT